MINWLMLLLFFILCQLAGIIGSLFTVSNIPTWYATLNKPSFNPPSWLFGPVWFILYAIMGISLYLIWEKGLVNKQVKMAFIFFLVHLIFNALWSVLFFGLKNPFLALLDIILLWLMIIVLIFLFWPIKQKAALLLVPYLLWVSFATILNYSVWQLNK